MDKNKSKCHLNGHKNDKIGVPLGIHDVNGTELKTGDIIKWYGEKCIILWNKEIECYQAMLLRSNWYGDYNIYDANSYGKAYDIHMDDGAKMEIELVKEN